MGDIHIPTKIGLCMKGNIFSEDKCPQCGKTLRYDGRNFVCPAHPGAVFQSTKIRVQIMDKGKRVRRRFNDIATAERFLNGLRFKMDEGSFDSRDYLVDNPLGFKNLAEKWLNIKKNEVKFDTFRGYRNHLNKAMSLWGQRNVKSISYGDLEDFFSSLTVAPKSKANCRAVIDQFFTWLQRREGVKKPEIPIINFELGWRKIIDLETQAKIIGKVYKIAPTRAYVGIKWLATYVAIRPKEMRFLLEGEINVNGVFVIPSPKEKKPKLVPMLPEDIELYKSLPPGLPNVYFFRHETSHGASKVGDQVGPNFFWKWWKRACKELAIEGVDLYGGTRHSTASALGGFFSREELKRSGTMHATNKAFERYMQHEAKPSLDIYEKAAQLRKVK